MAITTTLQRRFTLQKVFAIAVFLVLGLWGVYDYLVKIPQQEREYHRGQICFAVNQALTAAPGADARQLVADAKRLVDAEMAALVTQGLPTADGAPPPAQIDAVHAVQSRNDANWLGLLGLFRIALEEAGGRAPGSTGSTFYATVSDLSAGVVDATSGVSKPNKVDRITQWLFILCLPFVPYIAFGLVQAQRRVYRLGDDGTLSGPGFSWTRDEIADVDMSRWMAKSVAHVIHRDGRRVKLDDYVHRDVHRIVGALASRFHPEEWTEEAKLKSRTEEGAGAGHDNT